MPRGARFFVQNAYYHVMNRGNQKQVIFLDEEDFTCYLRLLKRYKRKHCVKVFGYCLMPNHVHLILTFDQPDPFVKMMQCMSQSYTFWFNRKYKKTGHLWQGRYKSMAIAKDDYLLNCISYVEANPVRSGLVSSPIDYLWSSYSDRTMESKGGILDFPDST